MTGEKLISVIVTAYNIQDYLPRCLESLLGQTYERLEIIVVDDGSTDGTAEICDRFAAKNEQIKVIDKSRLLKKICHISKGHMHIIDHKIKISLGLKNSRLHSSKIFRNPK